MTSWLIVALIVGSLMIAECILVEWIVKEEKKRKDREK